MNKSSPFSLDPPDAPNTPRVHEVTASSARLSWHEPKDNGSPILGYWIERKEVNSKYWTRVNRALINSLEVKVSNLMEGLTYIFRVCAENLAGPGPFSEPSDRTTAMDAICKYSHLHFIFLFFISLLDTNFQISCSIAILNKI